MQIEDLWGQCHGMAWHGMACVMAKFDKFMVWHYTAKCIYCCQMCADVTLGRYKQTKDMHVKKMIPDFALSKIIFKLLKFLYGE